MSSSSYLGHGAKYWADRYFELQTQTRMPDDSSSIEWRDKYLNLEKSCALYQSQIADLRTEVADLREKSPLKSGPELYEGHTAEYWYNEYTQIHQISQQSENRRDSFKEQCRECPALTDNSFSPIFDGKSAKYWYEAYCDAQNQYMNLSLEELKGNITNPVRFKGATAEEWAGYYDSMVKENAELHSQFRSLSTRLQACYDSSEVSGHDALYWSIEVDKLKAKAHKQQVHSRMQLFWVSIGAFILFWVGLISGEGYFAPHVIPDSPYIDEVKKQAASEAYSRGYDFGYDRGKNEGFLSGQDSGYDTGYKKGYNDGLNCESSSSTGWTAEKVRRMRESKPN